jgi:uncharacterized membrane protein YhhN
MVYCLQLNDRGNNRLPFLALALYAADVTIHLFACASKIRLMLRRVTKCLLMPLLALCYVLFAKTFSQNVLAAILFGFAGDLVLLFRPRHWAFPAGITAFAAGHVFYIVSFLSALPQKPAWYWFVLLGIISLTSAAVLLKYLWKGLPKKLRPPSFLYMLLIGAMASCAVLFGFSGVSPLCWLAAIGGLLFVISDTTLSIDAFHHTVKYRNVIVMSTYIAAQTLIVAALALT